MSAKACLLCLLCLVLQGQCMLAQYEFRAWTTDDGLPQNIVRDVYQTPDGYLWIATLDGLARFDGVRFNVFNTTNTPGLISNRLGLVGVPNGDLWIPTEGGDLMRYGHGRFATLGDAQGVRRQDVRGLSAGADGRTWILQDGEVFEWREQDNKFVNITPPNLKVRFEALRWDRAGFWGRSGDSLYFFRNGKFTSHPLSRSLAQHALWRVAAAPNGDIWIETVDREQFRMTDDQPPVQTAARGQSSTVAFASPLVSQWQVRIDAQLDRTLLLDIDGAPKSLPFSGIYSDRSGNLWIRTEGQGLYQVQRKSVHVYSRRDGLAANNIFPVYQDHTGAIWLGAWNSGLSRFANGKFTNFTPADGLPSELVTALFEDREGRLWIGTHGGLAVYEKGRFRTALTDVLPQHEPVQSILQDHEGKLWLGTRAGLFSIGNGRTLRYTEQDGLAANDTHVILESRSGDLWIGGYGGLTRIHQGALTRITHENGLPSDNIRALYEDSDGVLWIGTYDGGLARYERGSLTHYSTRDGLFNDGVFEILEDGHGNFWMSSNRGIYRVRKAELNEFAHGARKYISSVPYGRADGLLNEECNGGLWPAGVRTRSGELWFPTQAGVAIIQPDSIVTDPKPPPVLLESVLLDDDAAGLDAPIRVEPTRERIEIRYTSPSLSRPAQVRFRYMLDGLDRDWVDAGSRRIAYYSHVPPGHYKFRVIAANSDGVWSEERAPLAITVLAPFYRTWWFTWLILLSAAALVAVAWRYRVAQLQRAQAMQQAFSQELIASQESERKRIAAELHDSIGQRLVVIKNLALFILNPRQSSSAENDKQTITEIAGEVTLAIEETRQISYNLRPFQLDRLGLKKAIEAMARSVATASGLKITTTIDDIDKVFPEDLRINFYRIVQEALGNIMKHANASEVEIAAAKREDAVLLTVSDNGSGFTPSEAPPQPGKGGFGLTGMAERARLLGGQFNIQSVQDRGTIMTVNIPRKAEQNE